MSQRNLSTKIEKTCEGCGRVAIYEMVQPTEEQVNEMTQWNTVVREVWDGHSQQFVKLMIQSCSLTCVLPATTKLYQVVQEPEPDAEIDLDALRANSGDPTIN